MNIHSSNSIDTKPDPQAIARATEGLRAILDGIALLPGDDGYDNARAVWNAMIDRRPALIVQPLDAADVIGAVRFARDQGLPVAIKGGGHNVAGHGVCDDGLMIDLGCMRGVQVDPEARVARVEGGATWADVDRETQAHGLATPGGLISETGVAGLTLAGGIGWLRSRHGLCIDNLVALDVVTAEGKLVAASADQNADLFWALRGGGGNFGVVTRFTFALHPVGPTVMFNAPIYPVSAGARPIRFWRDFLADKQDRIGSLVEFSTVPESEDFPEAYWGQRCYTIAAVWAGDPDEGEQVMQPMREQGELITDFSGQMAYCDVQQLFDTLFPKGKFRSYWKCHYLAELSDAMIDAALENGVAAPSDNTLSSLWNMGAATQAVPAEATALGDRSMGWMYSLDSVWADPTDDTANIDWTRKAWQATRQHSLENRLYLNFAGHGEDGEALVKDAHGKNYARLAQIKAKYDPDNLFRFNQNIRPAA